MTIVPKSPDPKASFGSEAEEAIRSEQEAVRGLIDQAGLAGARASDIARSLSLDKTLAWKLTKFVEAPDPAAAFKHLPGPGGVEILVRAAEAAGVDDTGLDIARRTDRTLRRVIKKHAGDRRAFEAMLASRKPDPKHELEERRAFFRSGSAIWGVRAKAQFWTLILRPSPVHPDRLDCVQVSGFVGLELLKPDVPWVIRRLRTVDDKTVRMDHGSREPLDPAGTMPGDERTRPLSLLPEFCSRPLPVITQREGVNGWLYDELAPAGVGRSEARTVTAGELCHAIFPNRKSDDNLHARYRLIIRTPVEAAQLDLLLHPSLGHFRWPIATLAGGLEEQFSAGQRPERDLQPEQPAEALTSPGALGDSKVPRYTQMINSALARAGWEDVHAFRAYRACVEFPPPPCEIAITSVLDD